MTTVLFLGLGHMGGPMAANLAAAGHRVLGFDLVPEALEKARAAGVETVTDTAAAAAEADVVLTMLPHGRLVLDVYRGEDGDGGLLAAGLGQAAKICNNMVLGVTQIAVAEAFVLGERLGLQHQALYDVMSKASGQCWSLTTNCPVPGPVPGSPVNRDFQPGFAGALMAKDLGLALAALDEQGVAADLGRLAQAKYAEYAAGEGAARDFSGIIEDIRASHTDRSEA